MNSYLAKTFNVVLIAVLVFQFSGCGTILYPERRGQKGGHMDVGIVLLDGLGLLLFLIPGIIAFAVDFSNGTIYLPGTRGAQLRQIHFDPKHATLTQVEQIIKDQTGKSVKLTQENIKVTRLHSKTEMMAEFAKVSTDVESNQLALIR